MSLEKPRFRRDLLATPLVSDGQNYVEVQDPQSEYSFRFYDFEYRVALAFDGLTLDQVIPWVRFSTGLELTPEQLQEFACQLERMGFLESLPLFDTEESNGAAVMEPSSPISGRETGELFRPDVQEIRGVVLSNVSAESASARTLSAPASSPFMSPSGSGEAQLSPPVAARANSGASPTSSVPSDSTAFPVLPLLPQQEAPFARVPDPTPPSARLLPLPAMTPVPVTFGPLLPSGLLASELRHRRRSFFLFAALGVFAAGAVLSIAFPLLFSARERPLPVLRTLFAGPGTVYRYFEATGVLEAVPGLELKFPAAGKVIRIVHPGAVVADGEILAAVESARFLQERLVRQRERLSFLGQAAEEMHQAGNTQEEERIAAKVQGQSARLAKILKGLAEVALVADRSGEVLDILAHEGDTIQAGDPALRMRGTGCRVVFELPREERTRARRLGFCVVEVEGYAFDCTLAGAPDETRVTVEIASIPPSFAGKPAHLARSRFEGAVVLPASAIRGTGGKDRVLLVAPSGRAETRFVAIADKSPSEVIVIQGLDAGDEVILEAPHAVQSGMSVRASQ